MKFRRSFNEDSFEEREGKRKSADRLKSKELMDLAAKEFGKIIRQIRRDKSHK